MLVNKFRADFASCNKEKTLLMYERYNVVNLIDRILLVFTWHTMLKFACIYVRSTYVHTYIQYVGKYRKYIKNVSFCAENSFPQKPRYTRTLCITKCKCYLLRSCFWENVPEAKGFVARSSDNWFAIRTHCQV